MQMMAVMVSVNVILQIKQLYDVSKQPENMLSVRGQQCCASRMVIANSLLLLLLVVVLLLLRRLRGMGPQSSVR
jgi:hypothetical protein